jgi:isochorismate pyruvate lyase
LTLIFRRLPTLFLVALAFPAGAADPGRPPYRGTPSAAGGTCCETLGEVRANIDRIDAEMVRLIAEREDFVREAGRFKADPTVVEDPKRAEQIMVKVRSLADRMHANPNVVQATYRALLASQLEVEKDSVAKGQ